MPAPGRCSNDRQRDVKTGAPNLGVQYLGIEAVRNVPASFDAVSFVLTNLPGSSIDRSTWLSAANSGRVSRGTHVVMMPAFADAARNHDVSAPAAKKLVRPRVPSATTSSLPSCATSMRIRRKAMPLQNRVTPFGDIVAIPQRGTFTGNRGIIHDPMTKTLLTKRWGSKAWLICSCEYKGRRREVMGRRSWTELFFLDEAVALAAGHRPCFRCRREAAEAFRAAWTAAVGKKESSAAAMDMVLHRERMEQAASSFTPLQGRFPSFRTARLLQCLARPSRSRVVRRSAGPSTATSRRRGSLAPTVCSRRHQPS
jgi:hypothetical protein